MDIFGLDKTFFTTALFGISNYESCIWTERFFGSGDFELVLKDNPDIRAKLNNLSYVMMADSPDVMVVDSIEKTKDDKIKLKGRSLSSILSRRIIEDGSNTTLLLSDFVARLVDRNAAALAITERKFPGLSVDYSIPDGYANSSDIYTCKPGVNLYDTVQSLCQGESLGFTIAFDLNTQTLTFQMLNGRDYSTGDKQFLLSETLRTIKDTTSFQSDIPYRNVAIVNLPPKDVNTTPGLGDLWRISRTTTPTGFERREVWSDMSSARQDPNFTEAAKNSWASMWGRRDLLGYPRTNAFDFELAPSAMEAYGSSYKLGDILGVVDADNNITSRRITEYIRSSSSEGYSAYPTLESV